MKLKNKYVGYKIISKALKFVGHLYFGEKIIYKGSVPESGRCIIASNHLSDFDSYIFFSITNRCVHILGKKELFKFPLKHFFKTMQVIPIDRSKKNPESSKKVIDLLNSEEVIGIFPEGTYHKKTKLLPFKPGVISFAEKTDSPIIPIVISGEFKYRSHPKVLVGNPIYTKDIKDSDKVKYLEDLMSSMLDEIEKNFNRSVK